MRTHRPSVVHSCREAGLLAMGCLLAHPPAAAVAPLPFAAPAYIYIHIYYKALLMLCALALCCVKAVLRQC